jgi:phage shock protein B
MDDFVMWLGIVGVVVGPIWVILHYTTKWKQAPKITQEDEKLLDELYNLARRLEDRVNTVERIVAADNPDYRPGLTGPATADWKPGLAARSPYSIDRRN